MTIDNNNDQQQQQQYNNNNNNSGNNLTSSFKMSNSIGATTTTQNSNATNKLNIQQQMTNGLFIRKEIQRFESVHPNIYSVYDLIDTITDFNLQQQIREHIVNIEDSFVNSQEWTLSRSVPDIKLGILGAIQSGKSALVHRFLTGTYMQEESPEGGRFKKEVVIDGQSYLLLIRDEGGPPEMQFTHWVDAVILVFSLENEESFSTIQQYYLKMQHYRNLCDVPLILVGTQDYISESNPRLIDDTRARNLANELKRCVYYETCATYGLHVERVFHDACQKVVNLRTQLLLGLANTTASNLSTNKQQTTPTLAASTQPVQSISTSSIRHLAGQLTTNTSPNAQQQSSSSSSPIGNAYFHANPHLINSAALHSTLTNQQFQPNYQQQQLTTSQQMSLNGSSAMQNGIGQTQQFFHPNPNLFKEPLSVNQETNKFNKFFNSRSDHDSNSHKLDVITPCSTPNQKRKDTNRRRSNLFTPNKKEDKNKDKLSDMGIGRSIPIKQGFLYKKTNSSLNKDWKKKYVTLNDDGSLRYYPSMNDYMEDVHGKEIDLQKTTIKMPGANKPRIGKASFAPDSIGKLTNELNAIHVNGDKNYMDDGSGGIVIANSNVLTSANMNGIEPSANTACLIVPTLATTIPGGTRIDASSSNTKKRHRRVKSNHKANDQNGKGGSGGSGGANGYDDEQESFEFIVVSLDSKQWHFEASSYEEREEWVQAIEQQILSSLQSNETNKFKSKLGGLTVDNVAINALKNVSGNNACADCDAPNPVWATLNYGALICIECSGIHRNLGTHLSRVRSLELDDWSNELIQVMSSIGNKLINSIYEANCKGRIKPNTNSNREEKEKWIRAKYESKQFLAALPTSKESGSTLGKQLHDAVSKQDIWLCILLLSYCKHDDVNQPISASDKRTCLHIAASLANLVILQLLIWNGADVEITDNYGRNALYYARLANSMECVQLLLFNGCHDLEAIVAIHQQPSHPQQQQQQQQINSTLNRRSQSSSNHIIGTYDKLPYNVV